MAVEKIQVPDLGDSTEVEVIEILIAVGDEIAENDSMLVLETDKAAMEIPAPKGGVVKEILVKVGDQVAEGHVIIALEVGSVSADEPVTQSDESITAAVTEVPVEVVAAKGELASVSIQEIAVPDLGDDSDVEVIEILVAVGDEIQAEEGLITLETDKAAMDVPSPMAGKVTAIMLKIGDTVSQGAIILELEATTQSAAPAATPVTSAQPSDPAPTTQAQATVSQETEVTSNSNAYAGPAVRKLARELGVDLNLVSGTGIKSRIVKEDVHGFVKGRLQGGGTSSASVGGIGLPTVADIDFSKFGDIEEIEMTKVHRVTAQNMTRNWLTVPHVTQFEEVDITDLEEFRAAQKKLAEKKGIKLTPLPFIIKACAQALSEYPQFNVSLHSSGTKLIQKKFIHIGIAVATPAGLMVPVIKNADQKSIWELAAEMAELGEKAKERKLSRADMEGGCFTISSLGGIGGTGFTPIVNSPEVAIMGVSKTTVKPVYVNGELLPRKMMPYSLSYDHRAVNGVDGGLFCTYVTRLLSDIRLMVL